MWVVSRSCYAPLNTLACVIYNSTYQFCLLIDFSSFAVIDKASPLWDQIEIHLYFLLILSEFHFLWSTIQFLWSLCWYLALFIPEPFVERFYLPLLSWHVIVLNHYNIPLPANKRTEKILQNYTLQLGRIAIHLLCAPKGFATFCPSCIGVWLHW